MLADARAAALLALAAPPPVLADARAAALLAVVALPPMLADARAAALPAHAAPPPMLADARAAALPAHAAPPPVLTPSHAKCLSVDHAQTSVTPSACLTAALQVQDTQVRILSVTAASRATIARYRQAESYSMHSPIALDRSNRATRAIGASLLASERAQRKEQAAASGSDVGGEGIAIAARTAGNALGRRHNNVRRSGGSQVKAELHLVKHEGWILRVSYRHGGGNEAVRRAPSSELAARGMNRLHEAFSSAPAIEEVAELAPTSALRERLLSIAATNAACPLRRGTTASRGLPVPRTRLTVFRDSTLFRNRLLFVTQSAVNSVRVTAIGQPVSG